MFNLRFFLSILLLGTSFPPLSVNSQTKGLAKQVFSDERLKPCKFLSFNDAEKILGKPVKLMENSWNFADNKTTFDCTYQRVENDKATGQEVGLYFTIKETSTEEQSKKIYQDIWDSNKKHKGIEALNGIGDQAYSHSEKNHFHFEMVRKGKFTIILKVNRAVEGTSLNELKAFAKRVVEEL